MVPRATEAPGVIGQLLLNNPSGRRLTLSQVLSVVYEWVERRWSGMLARVRRRVFGVAARAGEPAEAAAR